ncbi:MAG: DUF962 domain-containing protein [Betaproteobacteria bacterium]|jgi:hypothetical protein|nr:DUF962 domain-containing protein [Betaproteobacteria bacterium]
MDTFEDTLTERRIDQLLAHYGESHQHPVNERIHFIAIPLIMLSLIGLIFCIHPWLAYGFMAASMVYYARLSRVFLAAMGVWSVALLALVHAMGDFRLPLCISIFVGAWVLQFIGHKLEGKKPSFFEDVQYLWVGPLFVLRPLLQRYAIAW